MMNEPRWLTRLEVDALHDREVNRRGGLPGVRDDDGIESALARPRQKWAYASPSLYELAAAYGFGLAKNHGYLDGNKRVAFVAVAVFLKLNGNVFLTSEEDVVETMQGVASGAVSEADLAAWCEANSQPVDAA